MSFCLIVSDRGKILSTKRPFIVPSANPQISYIEIRKGEFLVSEEEKGNAILFIELFVKGWKLFYSGISLAEFSVCLERHTANGMC